MDTQKTIFSFRCLSTKNFVFDATTHEFIYTITFPYTITISISSKLDITYNRVLHVCHLALFCGAHESTARALAILVTRESDRPTHIIRCITDIYDKNMQLVSKNHALGLRNKRAMPSEVPPRV